METMFLHFLTYIIERPDIGVARICSHIFLELLIVTSKETIFFCFIPNDNAMSGICDHMVNDRVATFSGSENI